MRSASPGAPPGTWGVRCALCLVVSFDVYPAVAHPPPPPAFPRGSCGVLAHCLCFLGPFAVSATFTEPMASSTPQSTQGRWG